MIINLTSFSIKIELLESDEKLPSFKTGLTVSLFHPTGTFKYSANDIWFLCTDWDSFLHSFCKADNETAVLKSVSEEFIVKIAFSDNTGTLDCSISESFPIKKEATLNFSSVIDLDDISLIKREFLGFDRFW